MCLDIVTPALKAAPSPVAAPSSTPTAFPFKKGDKVRILRKVKTYENGWNNAWTDAMDNAIGKVGTVSLVIPQDKDVTVEVPGIDNNFGYPAFALELVNESVAAPAEVVTTVTTTKKRSPFPVVGDRVEIPASLNSVWAGQGLVTSDYGGSRTVGVKMQTGKQAGLVGGFDRDKVILIVESETKVISTQPEVQPTPGPTTPKQSALQVARELAVSLAKQNPARTVTMDWVQDELAKRGFTSADLGNAAGVVFKGGQFENTGLTAKSNRAGNNRRKITVWKYVGDQTPTVKIGVFRAKDFPGPWIVQLSHDGGVSWSRSANAPGTFPTFEEARAEADRQHAKNGHLYQAAPLNSPVATPAALPVTPGRFVVETKFSDGWARSGNQLIGGTVSLSNHVFTTLEEAETEAKAQHARSISGREYRAVPYAGR